MMQEEEGFHKGQEVVFFNGRRPMRGKIVDKLEGDQYVIYVKSNGGELEIVKPANELKAYQDVKGQKARIRFLPPQMDRLEDHHG